MEWSTDDEILQEEDGDVIEHDRRHDLMGPRDGLEDAGDEPPERPCREPGRHRDRDGDDRWLVGDHDTNSDRAQSAHQELALSPDVEEAGLEAKRD